MTNKQRAYLTSLASKETAILQIGKAELTPEFIDACTEAIAKRELVKVGVLKNCFADPKELAEMLAERTRSEVVRVIGRKIILYRPSPNPVIEFPASVTGKRHSPKTSGSAGGRSFGKRQHRTKYTNERN